MIQFLLAAEKDTKEIIEQHQHVPMLGGRRKKSKNKRIRRRLAQQQREENPEQVSLDHAGAGPDRECPGGSRSHGGAASSHQLPTDPATPGSHKRHREHSTPTSDQPQSPRPRFEDFPRPEGYPDIVSDSDLDTEPPDKDIPVSVIDDVL